VNTPIAPGPTVASIARASEGRLLTLVEEQALARIARADPAQRGDAEALVVERNRGLVGAIMRRFRVPHGMELDDLEQEGLAGLLHGFRKWDPDRGHKLSTYVTTWIYQRMQRAIVDQSGDIRLPVHMAERLRTISRAARELRGEFGRSPSHAEIAAHLGTSVAWVEAGTQATRLSHALSMDEPRGDDEDRYLGDILPGSDDVEGAALTRVVREEVARVVARLDPRPRFILTLRYGLDGSEPRTLAAVAEVVGLTRERVRQLEVEAFKRLRELGAHLAPEGWVAPSVMGQSEEIAARNQAVLDAIQALGGVPGVAGPRAGRMAFWPLVEERTGVKIEIAKSIYQRYGPRAFDAAAD
jgi:RNA polymerase primary sigma factor